MISSLNRYNNRNEVIHKNGKYEKISTKNRVSLIIHDVTIKDRGKYTLKAYNEFEEKNLTLFLNVTGTKGKMKIKFT